MRETAPRAKALTGRLAVPSAKLAQAVKEMVIAVPWGHHVKLLTNIEQPAQRLYYLQATARFGWSRNVLLNQIKAQAHERSSAEGEASCCEIAPSTSVTEHATTNAPICQPNSAWWFKPARSSFSSAR